MKVVYLAGPYSHKDPLVREIRHQMFIKAEYLLIKQGILVIGPINMCHDLSKSYNLPSGYAFWQERDRELIKRADEVVVLMMEGWEDSVGLTDELKWALEIGKPVTWMNPEELFRDE